MRTDVATGRYQPQGVLYGVAYYPEYHRGARQVSAETGPQTHLDADRVQTDFELMEQAGITVIRVGESVWSTWEPQEGVFDLEWLAPVLDHAHARGISVILGTPTYAVPPWLQRRHPEIAAERSTGNRVPWGSRQEVDYSHPVFRQFAERMIRVVIGRYAKHPAVIGYQVDNEPGFELFHNDHVFAGFIESLRRQYGDVETINREWGLTYWSHRLSDFAELWRPDGNSFPQYDLAWREYQAGLTADFIGWQAGLVRECQRPEQFVTTCLQYGRPALDDRMLTQRLDITAGNPYYGIQDHLDLAEQRAPLSRWTTTGVAGLIGQGDRMYSSRQDRFLVTETNAQSIGGPDTNFPPYPGQLAQAAFALISRGAAMIEYWHWHTLPYGCETYWGGVLPHSLQPGRVYREVADIGQRLGAIGAALDGYTPDADITVLWSVPSRFALQYMPQLRGGSGPDPDSYETIVNAFHRGVVESGRQARYLHVDQAAELGAAELARAHPVIVAAGSYVLTDAQLHLLREYAEHGGHLILGPRTGYADELARARVATAPPTLTQSAGVWYDEFSNLDHPVPVESADPRLEPAEAAALHWIDGLTVTDAEVLVRYRHPRFADFPAVTTRKSGTGRTTVVGCVPDPALARAIMAWAAPSSHASDLVAEPELPITVASGKTGGGRRVWFAFNWGWQQRPLTLAHPARDLFDGTESEAGTRLVLGAWEVRAFVSPAAPESSDSLSTGGKQS